MSRHRFYAPPSSIDHDRISLDANDSHHLRHVLRLRPGATVFVFDGSGTEYVCKLEGFDRDRTRLSIIGRTQPAVESPLDLTLAQGLTKGDKFEVIVQKATELGIRRIIPLITAHSLSSGMRSVSEQHQRRWRRIALEAAKQCGGTRLTEITRPLPWREFLVDLPQPALLFSEQEGRTMADLWAQWREAPPPGCILVGPEGGWQRAEIEAASAAGAVQVWLGPRILRAETAAVVAIGLVQSIFINLAK